MSFPVFRTFCSTAILAGFLSGCPGFGSSIGAAASVKSVTVTPKQVSDAKGAFKIAIELSRGDKVVIQNQPGRFPGTMTQVDDQTVSWRPAGKDGPLPAAGGEISIFLTGNANGATFGTASYAILAFVAEDGGLRYDGYRVAPRPTSWPSGSPSPEPGPTPGVSPSPLPIASASAAP